MKKDGELSAGWLLPVRAAGPYSRAIPLRSRHTGKSETGFERGERVITAESLYVDDGMAHLSRRPDELLTEVQLPPINGWKATYWKLRRRGSFDFPILGVATCLKLAADGTVEDAKIIMGGVGSHPIKRRPRRSLLSARS